MGLLIETLALCGATTGAAAQVTASSPSSNTTVVIPADVAQDKAAGTADPLFQQPYIDKDEWRDAPVRHRYIHGGFNGTDAKFSFYFPDKAGYQGRFFQYITPFPISETLTQQDPPGEFNHVGFALASGGYFVETNGGGAFDLGRGQKGSGDPSVSAYRANAAAADYSRVVAKRIFASQARPYGYAFGGSGGAYRTIGAAENTSGVWDGFVPYVAGSSMAIPNVFTVRMLAMQRLHSKFAQIVDAMEPGGSGDPYKGLDADEAAALREVSAMGFPQRSWFGWKTMGIHGFIALYGGMLGADPSYFADFWTKPGYLGHDAPEQFKKYRVQYETTIAGPLTAKDAVTLGLKQPEQAGGVDSAFNAAAPPVGFRLSGTPPQVYFLGGDMIVKSGAAAGQKIMLVGLKGDAVGVGVANPDVLAKIKPGDQVQIDNSAFLAAQTYHRHQVPGPEFKVWDQFRDAAGKPLYPQRPMLIAPLFVQGAAGSVPKGAFHGKMIIVESLLDREAYPWQADWYRQEAQKKQGVTVAESNFRVWMNDNTLHGDEPVLEDPSRSVGYMGMLQQALRDVATWAEHNVAPPPSTNYRVVDGQVIVPASAAERLGVQPVVTLAANRKVRADIAKGDEVTLVATAEVPPGTGRIVSAEWDPEGAGTYPVKATIPPSAGGKVTLAYKYRYTSAGTVFPGIRVRSERQGRADSVYAQPVNIARARVVVR
ncbi:hypothetical protein [Sphingomonas sp. Leaf67]|uniref:hypothetical protein n=1 Tax=Sphingomonas sp. Leaf67 TaxID=1736230 RepID=UPI0039E005E5